MVYEANLQDNGRFECAATFLTPLLFPEWAEPDHSLDTRYHALCGYLLRQASERGDGWAENLQRMRPIHAFMDYETIARTERDVGTRLKKALWAGLVAKELLDGYQSIEPSLPARRTVAPIARDFAGHLRMTATNFAARAWRPWMPSIHLCVALADVHVGVTAVSGSFNLVEALTSSDEAPAALAALAEEHVHKVLVHPKIPVSASELLRVHIS